MSHPTTYLRKFVTGIIKACEVDKNRVIVLKTEGIQISWQ